MKFNRKTVLGILLAGIMTVSASAAFSKTNTYADGQFTDVPASEWYAKEVKSTYELGLMNGIGGGLFDPEGNVTVAEAITMASRAASINSGETIAATDGEWYQMYVNYAASKGFVKEGQFDNFDRPAKRYEVALLFENAMPDGYFAPKNDVSDIHDIPDSRAYKADVLNLYKAGVVMGSDAYGTFNPEHNITRAEAAAIINRVALPENRLAKTLDKITEDDAYTFVKTPSFDGANSGGIFSGWSLDNRGGLPRKTLTEPYGSLIDVRDDAGAALIRDFNKTSTGKVDLYATFKASGDGVYLEFKNEAGESVYKVDYAPGKWSVNTPDGASAIYEAEKDEEDFRFNIVLDLDNDRATTYINGKNCGTHKTLTAGDATNILNFRIATTEKDKPIVAASSVNAYNNYALFEDFSETADGVIPKYFTLGEGATVTGNELYLTNSSAFAGFDAVSGKVIAEIDMLLPEKEAFYYNLSSSGKAVLNFTTDANNMYANGVKVYDNYYGNLWYRMRFELDTDAQLITIKLNGRKVGEVPFAEAATSVNSVSVANLSATKIQIDEFKVFKYIEHDDYCPVPVIPEGADDYNIGLNICSLWKNGATANSQWSVISSFSDREPVLGYYDEGYPETADWEIKYMLEHGIDFQAFCVYFNTAYGPIKLDDNDLSAQLLDGFMNAKYSDMAKYCILWEAGAYNPYALESMEKYFAPYIIENFFKDPRYMVIDNQPVICMFSPGSYKNTIGGAEKMKESFDYLENEAKKLGFDGVIYIACANSSKDLADCGFDGCYAYSWGTSGNKASVNIESISNSASEGSVYTVPTVSVGFDSMPWHGKRYGLISLSDYEKAHKWVRDEYLPKNAKEDWQKNFVMISTWNEYGEGTYISPTTREDGFGYVDVIRDIYTKGGKGDASVNLVPTVEQRYRINHLYPQYKKLLRKEGYPVESSESTVADFTPVYTIDYTQMKITDANLWDEVDAKVTEEGLSGSTGNDTIVIFADLEKEFEGSSTPFLDSVSAIRVTAKLTEGAEMELFYITEDDTSWSQGKSKRFPKSTSNDWQEYVIDVKWSGKLKGVRLDPAAKPGNDFVIKSVEFLADEKTVSRTMLVDGEPLELEFAPVKTDNGNVLISFDPAKAVDFRLNCFYEWFKDKSLLKLYFIGHEFEFTVGENKYKADGKEVDLGYALPDVDSLPMIPVDIICGIVGYEYNLNESKQIEITTDNTLPKADESTRVPGKWEFDTVGDTEGWKSTFMSLVTYNGFMSCSSMSDSTDPVINWGSKLNEYAMKYNKLEIKVRYNYSSEKAQRMQLFFSTDKSSGMSEDKSINIPLNSKDTDGKWEVYTYDLTQLKTWQDKIVSLRFDPFNAKGNMDIEYIRFIEDPEFSEEKIAEEQARKEAEELANAKEYPVPAIGIEDENYGTLIWYNDFENGIYNDAEYAKKGLKFASSAVSGSVEVVDNVSGDGKVLKVTPNSAHGGYRINFPKTLSDKGTYTFVVDFYIPEEAKHQGVWLRWEAPKPDGTTGDPSSWKTETFIKGRDTWCNYVDTFDVGTTYTGIRDYSIRKEVADVYYIDNVKIYFKAAE